MIGATLLKNPEFLGVLEQLFAGDKQAFVKYINDNKTTFLDLSLLSNNITDMFNLRQLKDAQLKMIFDTLKDVPAVKKISIAGQRVGYANAATLIRMLQPTNVDSIDLRINFCENKTDSKADFAQAIVDSKITSVNLGNNRIDVASAKELLTVLKMKAYKQISFEGNPISNECPDFDDVFMRKIDPFNSDSAISKLNGLKVQSLCLKDTHIGDKGATEIAQWLKTSNVERVDISKNDHITDAGADALVKALPESQVCSLPICQPLTAKIAKTLDAVNMKRNMSAYYSALFSQMELNPQGDANLTEREKELKVGVIHLLKKVPFDVRQMIESYATNGKTLQYRNIRARNHPKVIENISVPHKPQSKVSSAFKGTVKLFTRSAKRH